MRRFRFIIGILSASAVTVTPAATMAQIISITIAPPALPVYVQPAIPEPGFLWTPGYWAYGPDGYFWAISQAQTERVSSTDPQWNRKRKRRGVRDNRTSGETSFWIWSRSNALI
jgi:hypothetical protein